MGILRRAVAAISVSLLALLAAPSVNALPLADGLAPQAAAAIARSSALDLTKVDDNPEECSEPIPATYSTAVAGPSPTISLDVLVLLDGIEEETAAQAVAQAAKPFAALDVTLTPTYEALNVKPDSERVDATTGKRGPAIEAQALVAAARDELGGARPEGIDVVYVMTAKDLYLGAGDADIAGWADCIGGVRYPKRAFAVGETPSPFNSLGLNYYLDATAKVLAHEIGHLLGAHHQYANCAQGAGGEDVTRMEPAVCTLMFAYLDLQSLHFGVIEDAVIRGHAEDYASP